MKRHYLFLLTILLLTSCREDNEPLWFDEQYVFLELIQQGYNEVIEGEDWNHLEWDGFGNYSFDRSDGTLWGVPLLSTEGSWDEVEMTGSTQMILGSKSSDNGDVVGGYGASLHEIHYLPTTVYKLNVTRIDEDGAVYFTYNDSSMVLVANEEWSKTWTQLETEIHEIDDWDEWGERVTWTDTLLVKYTYHDRITNWGLLEKSQFLSTTW